MAPSVAPAGTSIQRRLLHVLMGSLLGVVVLSAGVTYFVAHRVANDEYDHVLLDPAMDLAKQIQKDATGYHLALTPREREALLFDGLDQFHFEVRDRDGQWIAGSGGDLPKPSSVVRPDHPVFYNATVGNVPVRVCAVRGDDGIEVLLAETMRKRDRLSWEIILAGLIPSLLVVVVAMVLVWLGVSHGLAPLRRLRDELQQRSPFDLRALDESHAPQEVQPAIAALNRLFARIVETSESQRRFLADAAHQLRTPLAGLQMQLELELRDAATASLRSALGKMRDAVVRTGKLTNRLLALARAEQAAGDQQRFTPVDLAALAERVGTQWIVTAIDHNIDLGFELQPASVMGDEPLLAEMLGNLLDNAIRYTSSGGTVTVRCGLAKDGPFLEVEDNGEGIPADEREKVLQRFYRGKNVAAGGAGLGLAIVKEGAERHGAAVLITTPVSGKGVLISIVFGAGSSASETSRARAPEMATIG